MNNIKIGKLISELRNKKKLTQQELGDKIGVGFRAVSKWECGQTLPDISNMKELSKIFGITLDELLSGELKVKKKLSKKYKIIISLTSTIILILATALILVNTKDKTYVYNLSTVDKENYNVKGQITFSEESILIVISELIFCNDEVASTKVTNYEYTLMSNNQKLVNYGYSPFIESSDEELTIKKISNSFKINATVEKLISEKELVKENLTLVITFIDEKNNVITSEIELKATLTK